ncbi:cyclopropane-fatty-acyl-phospholipid synthase family protein [Kiloniella sp. b19]|uniref:cyclopropane-fatty-acyl-phospholipid synthase family protein n=1 Tax=Kiloniella sp. GXU_MW_B19 TaxID=3141326 RepID=UPI0031DE07F0
MSDNLQSRPSVSPLEGALESIPLPHTPDLDKGLGFMERQVLNFMAHIEEGYLVLHLPNGHCHCFGDQEADLQADITFHSLVALRRSFFGGDLGFAESYLKGEWSSSNLSDLLLLMLRNLQYFKTLPLLATFRSKIARLRHLMNDNSLRGSRRNIAYHYDLGNDFYRLWLDPTMTYSSALFGREDQTLEEAQDNKYDTIADWADLDENSRVLEIGCGWGGFARRCHQQSGSRITGLTLSREQLAFARQKAAEAGLEDRLEFRLEDYRHCRGQYDAIVSIEMFEAVGEKHWESYFTTLHDRLKTGGKAVLQIITIADDRYPVYRKGTDFIQQYIFPGGFLPSPSVLREQFAKYGFRLEREHFFGQDYARTLAVWREAFLREWPELEKQGFDERFKRMWLYYLSYCEAGFVEDSINVGLFKIVKTG